MGYMVKLVDVYFPLAEGVSRVSSFVVAQEHDKLHLVLNLIYSDINFRLVTSH